MSSVAELDRSNVVDVDLGSAEFKANAHKHMADWATRRPFYVLGRGQPQVVVEDARELLPEVSDVGAGPFVQLWPHRHGTDAMFFALLRRTA